MDSSIFNYAPVPVGKFKGWKDETSPFSNIEIPKGTRWMYGVFSLLPTPFFDNPLGAGFLLAGPFLTIEEVNREVSKVEQSGKFCCVQAAVVYEDKNRSN